MKKFAKLYEFPDIGQVLVTIDETEIEDQNGPEIKVDFSPSNLGICSVKFGNFGKDEDEAWEKGEASFNAMTEENAYNIAKKVIDEYNGFFAESEVK